LACGVFGVTGVVAATAAVTAVVSADVVLPAWKVVVKVMAEAAAVLAVAPLSGVVVDAVPGSVLSGVVGPAGDASGWELAAIAAAAIASGAVGPPEVGVAGGGVLVEGTDVGTATATGVVAVLAACCARRVASIAVEPVSVAVSLDFVSVDGVESDEAVDDDWLVLPVVAPFAFAVVPEPALLASDGWLEFAALLLELPLAGGGGGALLLAAAALLLALLFEALLAGGSGWLAALFWGCGGGGGGKVAGLGVLVDQTRKKIVGRRRIGARQPGRRGLERGIGCGCGIWGSTDHWTASDEKLNREVSKDRATP
jgi:hypothetical protein